LNPVTAIIPVVMYTSESGDVYVSQARAVGAMEVLSKDMLTESDIEQVMKSANIFLKSKSDKENDKQELKSVKTEPRRAEVTVKPSEASANLLDVRNQVSRAIELQHSKIQRDIQDSSRMITRRLMHEVKELQNSLKQQEKPPSIAMFANLVEGLEQPKPPSIFWFLIPMFLLMGLVAYGIYQVDSLKKENQSLVDINHQFASILAKQNDGIIASVERLEVQNSQNAQISEKPSAAAFDNMIWTINQNSNYEYGTFPLDASRTEVISELLIQLDESDFSGVVNLNIQSGNFCVITNESGELVLPDADSLLADCELIEYYSPDPSQIERTAFEFSTLLNTNPTLLEGYITIAVNAFDQYSSNPQYPEFDPAMTAGQWNNVALQNNHIFVELESY